jgi:hypothetical protein
MGRHSQKVSSFLRVWPLLIHCGMLHFNNGDLRHILGSWDAPVCLSELSIYLHGGVKGCQGGVNKGVSGAPKDVNGGGKRCHNTASRGEGGCLRAVRSSLRCQTLDPTVNKHTAVSPESRRHYALRRPFRPQGGADDRYRVRRHAACCVEVGGGAHVGRRVVAG